MDNGRYAGQRGESKRGGRIWSFFTVPFRFGLRIRFLLREMSLFHTLFLCYGSGTESKGVVVVGVPGMVSSRHLAVTRSRMAWRAGFQLCAAICV